MMIIYASNTYAQDHKVHMKNVNNYARDIKRTEDFATLKEWNEVLGRQPVKAGRGKITWDKVAKINAHCNAKEYKIDPQWYTPKQFAKNLTGDCKGMSICKYYELRTAGAAPAQVNLWSGDYKNNSHMVVTVKIAGESKVLDIGAEDNLPLAKDYFFKNFQPTYRFNENGWDVN